MDVEAIMRASSSLLVLLVLAACTPALPTPTDETGEIEVHVVAGPVCPVETVPPDPACEPRPVPGAHVFVSPGDGREVVVAEGTTDADGIVHMSLPPGAYVVSGSEVERLIGLPAPTTVTVDEGQRVVVTLEYDTGIR
jgi:hypothetical protein